MVKLFDFWQWYNLHAAAKKLNNQKKDNNINNGLQNGEKIANNYHKVYLQKLTINFLNWMASKVKIFKLMYF